MSRCPYCHRQLPGFETVCQKCFEAGYDRVTDTRPWWKPNWSFRRPHFNSGCLYLFLFMFGFFFQDFRFFWHHSTKGAAFAALAIALAVTVLESITEGNNPNPKQKKTPE